MTSAPARLLAFAAVFTAGQALAKKRLDRALPLLDCSKIRPPPEAGDRLSLL